MALSDTYHDITYQFKEESDHYLYSEVFGHSKEDKKRAELIFKLILNESAMLDLNLDGMVGDKEALVKFQLQLKKKDKEVINEQNEILKELMIKYS